MLCMFKKNEYYRIPVKPYNVCKLTWQKNIISAILVLNFVSGTCISNHIAPYSFYIYIYIYTKYR